MKVEKKDLEKSQVELTVELSFEEFSRYISQGVENLSKSLKIEGFRPGKAPFEAIKNKIGEMAVLEEVARVAINKTLPDVIDKHLERQPVGHPDVNITKLAPNNPFEYKVVLSVLPEVTLGEYKGLKIKKKKVEVADEEVNKTIDEIREINVKEAAVDREVRDGDKVLVDIKMFLDNVPIEGGQSQGTAVIIGKNYVIPGFDKKLLGAKKGDTREFSLPYPKDFYQKNLAGKMVDFKVEIKEVYSRELPEVNDDFAKRLQFSSVEDLKKGIRKNIEAGKKQEAEQALERDILDKLVEKTKFGDLPEILINHETDTMMREMEQGIANQGGRFEDYLTSIKKTRDQFKLDIIPEAIKRVKASLLLREIAKKEKIQVSEAEINDYAKALLEHYKNDKQVEERVNSPEYRAYIHNTIENRKVIEKLREWNTDGK